jgi:hypothetical protein
MFTIWVGTSMDEIIHKLFKTIFSSFDQEWDTIIALHNNKSRPKQV